jgi:hypothetical protein
MCTRTLKTRVIKYTGIPKYYYFNVRTTCTRVYQYTYQTESPSFNETTTIVKMT